MDLRPVASNVNLIYNARRLQCNASGVCLASQRRLRHASTVFPLRKQCAMVKLGSPTPMGVMPHGRTALRVKS